MSKYFWASQVNILDIWCNITRYFVSHFTANYFDISSGFLRWILRIFCRMSVSYVDVPSCVSLWIFTILRRQSHGILSLVSRLIISTFLPALYDKFSRYFVGRQVKLFGYFVVSPAANYFDVLYDASQLINAVFFGRLMVNFRDTVGYLKGQLPQRSDGHFPVNYRNILSGTSQ